MCHPPSPPQQAERPRLAAAVIIPMLAELEAPAMDQIDLPPEIQDAVLANERRLMELERLRINYQMRITQIRILYAHMNALKKVLVHRSQRYSLKCRTPKKATELRREKYRIRNVGLHRNWSLLCNLFQSCSVSIRLVRQWTRLTAKRIPSASKFVKARMEKEKDANYAKLRRPPSPPIPNRSRRSRGDDQDDHPVRKSRAISSKVNDLPTHESPTCSSPVNASG